jgi:hypothetical protein
LSIWHKGRQWCLSRRVGSEWDDSEAVVAVVPEGGGA